MSHSKWLILVACGLGLASASVAAQQVERPGADKESADEARIRALSNAVTKLEDELERTSDGLDSLIDKASRQEIDGGAGERAVDPNAGRPASSPTAPN